MVREDVSAIQVDEPLNVFDPHMKWALTFGDKLVVMHDAQAVHLGSPLS